MKKEYDKQLSMDISGHGKSLEYKCQYVCTIKMNKNTNKREVKCTPCNK